MNKRIKAKKRLKAKKRYKKNELWDLRTYLARDIRDAIIQFKNSGLHGFPGNPDEGASMKEWFKTLDEIIWYFDQMYNDFPDDLWGVEHREEREKYWDRMDNAGELFIKYFGHLWD